MLRLTNLADYAVVLMTAAARQSSSGLDRLSASTISGLTGIPVPTAGKLMNLLGRAGLLTSTRGVCGGFRLSRPADEITLAEIIEAVDGPIALTTCVQEEPCGCQIGSSCQVRPHWSLINSLVRDVLAGVTLASLSADASGRFSQGAPLGNKTEVMA